MSKSITCYPATSNRWKDLTALFGKSGAYWGCWCTYWIMTNKQFNDNNAKARKQALKILVEDTSNEAPGLLAYIDNRPVGWCAVNPRGKYARLVKSRVIKPVDDLSVWSVVCFFIHKDFRGQSVASALLQAAVNYAVENGAPAIEGYPIDSGNTSEKINEDAAYVGTRSMFEKAGFQMVADTKAKGAGKPRIIMRYPLESV